MFWRFQMDCIVVLVTSPNEEHACTLSQKIIELKLAACVNMLPKTNSIYLWNDKIERSEEVLMVIKTNSANLVELEEKILSLHPYDTPEFIAIEAKHVTKEYLSWMNRALKSSLSI